MNKPKPTPTPVSTTQPPAPASAAPPSSAVPPQPPAKKVNPLKKLPKIKNPLKSIKLPAIPPRLKSLLPKLAITFVIILILLVAATFIYNNFLKNGNGQPSPTPTAEPESTSAPLTLSPYAEDEEIKSIEAEIEALESELKLVNFRDDTLRIPTLDWSVEFKE